MLNMLQVKCIDLILIGKTGHGKSATGNSILKRNVFNSRSSMSPVTRDIEVGYGECIKRVVKVVDTPGLEDGSSTYQLVRDMSMVIATNPEGYHAFLFVVRFGARLTHEEKQLIEVYNKIFGNEVVKKYFVLVVTGGDMYHSEDTDSESFEDWCSAQVGVFHNLIVECRNRVVLFDNRTKDPDTKTRQLKRLFQLIDTLPPKNEQFTDTYFKMAKNIKESLLLEYRTPNISEETLMNVSLIIQEFRKNKQSGSEIKLSKSEALKRKVNNLLKFLETQDCTNDTIRDMSQIARHLKETLHYSISMESWHPIYVREEKSKRSEQCYDEKNVLGKAIKLRYDRMKQLDIDCQHEDFEVKQLELESTHEELERQIKQLELQYTALNSTYMLHVTRQVGEYLVVHLIPICK